MAGENGRSRPIQRIAIILPGILLAAFWVAVRPALAGEPPKNLALNRPATASSIENDEHDAAKANDGDPDTCWTADDEGDGSPAWWQVDLGTPADLAGCEIRWEFDGQKYQYKVEGSADGRAWSILSDQTKNTRTSQVHHLKFENAKAIRYIRITVVAMSEGCWASISEVKAFGRQEPPS